MKKPDIIYRKTVTTKDDDYFQSINIDVTLTKIRKKKEPCRISIWGDDDIGMVLYIKDFDEARTIYNSIINNVTVSYLEKIGFKQD